MVVYQKKKRNILQIGFFLNFNVFFQTNKPPSISAELIEPFVSSIINNKYKLNCLLSTTSIINLSIIDGQKIDNIYKLSSEFITEMINKDKWIFLYFEYLFNLLKTIGYEIDYNQTNKKYYFDLDNLNFHETKTNSSLTFPFELFQNSSYKNLKLVSIINFFKIFETVMIKNQLFNINHSLPNQYLLFKNLLIEYFKSK